MTTFLTGTELASYLERDESPQLTNIAQRTNALIDQEWADPVDPAPEWVKNIAWDVAIRAGANPTGATSTTKAWDDISRTDRFEAGQRNGVYLTDDEKALLHGPTGVSQTVAAGSIKMQVPGWSRPEGFPCY